MGMSEEHFTKLLREYTQRKPFVPFVVETKDGRRIVVDNSAVAFGAGVAGFISENDGLVDFSCDEVRSIAHITAQTTS
jgi:hypothetical protein